MTDEETERENEERGAGGEQGKGGKKRIKPRQGITLAPSSGVKIFYIEQDPRIALNQFEISLLR